MRRRDGALLAGLVCAACAVGAGAAAAAGPPEIGVATQGTLGDNGWYTSEVQLTWTVTGADTAAGSCGPGVTTNPPISAETTGTQRSCSASNAFGTTAKAVTVRIDRTPPTVSAATPDRPPDAGGFYNHPVAVSWTGSDAVSGVAGCTSASYGGPDGDGVTLSGTCRDNAGHTSAPLAFTLRYDATAPAISAVAADAGDTQATLRWAASPDTHVVRVNRARADGRSGPVTVYEGRGSGLVDRRVVNGTRYAYTVTAFDAAGNAVTRSVSARPASRLLRPAAGAQLRRPPVLRWKRARRARYYNVQLYRGDRKVLSAWPTRPRLRLRRTWTYAGQRRRLRPGAYRWYVFPGYGARSQRRYGALLGTRAFRIQR